jgi:hypothetical protein
LALLDHLLRHILVPRIRYLRFTTRGKKGPLITTGDMSAWKSKRSLIQLLTVNTPRHFEVGDYVYLNVSPTKGVQRFGVKGKLAPRYIGPYEVIEVCGPVAYRIQLL